MDQEKIGRFIAQLRREQRMTQEALGQELLVTNKTVSRWETGAYLPDLETLLLLSRLFQVSLEELLAGERLDRRPPAPTPVPLPSDRFSKKEREAFYTAKWRRDHLFWLCLAVCAAVLLPFLLYIWKEMELVWMGLVADMLLFAFLRNRRMAYVEAKLYPAVKAEGEHR